MARGLFTLERVTASRAGRPVLNDLSLSIDDGATAVLGPSGAGKSTLLRLLNPLADPDSGCVRFHGADVRSLDPLELRRRACLVPQLPAPLPGSVADNVRYGPGLRGRDADVDRCLELAGLHSGYAGREAERLSVGEQQRVMLARALALEPEVLLLDEPTSALDPIGRREVRDLIRRLRADGVAVLLNSHLLSEVELVCDRVAIVDRGRVVRSGRLDEVVGKAAEIRVTLDRVDACAAELLGRFGEIVALDGDTALLATDDVDAAPRLAAALVGAGYGLRALVPVQRTLEDVFVGLVESEGT